MKEEKNLLLQEVKDKIENSQGFVVTAYQGFSAAYSREFRNNIASLSAEFEVVKKKIFFKALEQSNIQLNFGSIEGHFGVVFAYDNNPAQVAKRTLEFSETHNDSLTILGGLIDNIACSGQEVTAIAKLPSLQELRAQIVGLLQAPMTQVVGVMQSALTDVLYCMEEKSKKS